MKKTNKFTKCLGITMAVTILFTSCASTTMIQTIPSGAKVYVDGTVYGETPCAYTDTKIVGSKTSIRLEKEGYETLNTMLVRNEEVDAGAIVGGLFFWFPFLWTMQYRPDHTYELLPMGRSDNQTVVPTRASGESTTLDKLRNLKTALDEGLITQQEYEVQKAKILNEK